MLFAVIFQSQLDKPRQKIIMFLSDQKRNGHIMPYCDHSIYSGSIYPILFTIYVGILKQEKHL